MTTSSETYPTDEQDARRRLEAEFDRGRRGMLGALAVIAAITLPMIGWWTRDVTLTGFAATIIVVCGTFAVMRYNHDVERQLRENLR